MAQKASAAEAARGQGRAILEQVLKGELATEEAERQLRAIIRALSPEEYERIRAHLTRPT
jgi:hypothetical protein